MLLADDADRLPDRQRVGPHVVAGDDRGPRVATESVVRMRTVVDLPAPFGPRRPNTVPASTLEVHAVQGLHLAVSLLETGRLDRVLEHCLSHLEQCSTPVQCSCQMPTSRTPRGGARRTEAPRDKRPLTRELIVDAALALLERDGLQGLSMRRLAHELDRAPRPCTGMWATRRSC